MKGLRTRIWLAISLLSLVTVIWLDGCQAEPNVLEQDIVFGIDDSGEKARFGLVNADGSGLEYLEFQQPKKHYAAFPVWSPDKTQIAYLNTTYPFTGGSGDILWVDVMQGEAKHTCTSDETKAWRISDRPRYTPDGKWWLVEDFAKGVVFVNPLTCEIEQVLVPTTVDKYWLSPDLSVQNELVYSMVLEQDISSSRYNVNLGYIVVKDLNTNEIRELGRGLLPSWSPDGEWIVFTKQDGLYLIRRDGQDEHQTLQVVPWWEDKNMQIDLLRASWSPDGRWVVYSKLIQRDGGPHFDIYKLDVNTGEEVKIAEDGGNPHWYWPPKPIVGRTQ